VPTSGIVESVCIKDSGRIIVYTTTTSVAAPCATASGFEIPLTSLQEGLKTILLSKIVGYSYYINVTVVDRLGTGRMVLDIC
jgi:hypothetical protein